MSAASDVTRRPHLIANSMILRFLQSSYLLFHNIPLALGMGVFYKYVHWDWAPLLCILIIVVLYSGLFLRQRIFLMKGEHCTYLWEKGNMFIDCC